MGRGPLWLRLLGRMPVGFAQGLGAALGWALALTPSRRRYVSEVNLRLCLPELSLRRRARLVRRSLVETGKTFGESIPLLAQAPASVLSRVREVTGEGHIRQALSEGRGVIIASPHLGAWEVGGIYLSHRYTMTSMYRPEPRAPAIDAVFLRGRQRAGAHLVRSDAGGVRALYQALRDNQLVAVLPDQNPGGGSGVFVPFFGVPTNTPVLLARLARKQDAAVIYGYAERLSGRGGYRIHFEPPDEAIHQAADLEGAAAAMNQALERLIRRCPEQYYWSYKRFRKRPPGEKGVY